MASLSPIASDYIVHIQQTASPAQTAAVSQALAHFFPILAKYCNLPQSQLTIEHLGVGGFEHYLLWLQRKLSVETEHQYSRAVLDFYSYTAKRLQTDLPLETLSIYLDTNRRSKSHEIQPPPLSLLRKITDYARLSPMPDESTGLRTLLRFCRDKAFILLIAATGMKLADLCDLRVADLDSHALPSFDQKLANSSQAAIDQYLRRRHSLDTAQVLPRQQLPLFARHDKRASDQILSISRWTAANIINAWVDQALSPEDLTSLAEGHYTITSQSFRDAFVLHLLYQTKDLHYTMSAAGHADPTTTRRYLHLVQELTPQLEALS